MLPEELTESTIEETCDLNNSTLECLLDQIDDPMSDYMDEIVELLVEQFGLDEKQTDELQSRLTWKLTLLPPSK